MRLFKLRSVAMVVIPAILTFSGLQLLRAKDGDNETSKTSEAQRNNNSPDIKTVISSSISSVQKQNQLLVLTARMNATATTTVKEMGMEGWKLDIASSEAQYLVDLKQLDAKKILVDGKEITIILPRTALLIKQLPPVITESKDNDSWLFTWRPEVREKLTQYNRQKITKSFMLQAQEQKDTAYLQARDALGTIFNTPIKVAGLQHHVTIMFQ